MSVSHIGMDTEGVCRCKMDNFNTLEISPSDIFKFQYKVSYIFLCLSFHRLLGSF